MLRLVVGNLNYSSWSMRPWLALKHAHADFKLHDIGMMADTDWRDRVRSFSGAGKVPILVDGNLSVHESLAICEYVAELFPEARLWPVDVKLRARGRAISCEMLSGFQALRARLSCNLRGRAERTPGGADADIARILDIWEASLGASGGPFLLGEFSIADCMFFPVASRFRTYRVALPVAARAYCERLFQRPDTLELEQIAAKTPPIAEYDALLEPLR
jgi:glutathione S-transferase